MRPDPKRGELPRPNTSAARLLKTLDKWFTTRELHNATGIPQNSIGPELSRLRRAGLIQKRSPTYKRTPLGDALTRHPEDAFNG